MYRDWSTYLVELQRKYNLRRPGAKDVIAQVIIGEFFRRIISANDLGEFSRRILSANSLGEFSRRILSANVTGVAIHIHVHYIHVSQFNGPDERAGRAVKECAAHAEARLLIGYARPVEEVLSVLGATRVNSPREFAEISRVIRRDNVPR